jgi:DNA polymerase-3 subunit delta'
MNRVVPCGARWRKVKFITSATNHIYACAQAQTDDCTLMTDNWNLVGHEWAVGMLQKHVANGTTRHAYLFAGPPGIGRRTLALRFAQALNCPTPAAAGVPCGECRDCKQIAAMQHADLSIIEPTIRDPNNSKELVPAPNGEIRISQIRELQKTINLKPYQSRYRVLIFIRFHQANVEACNALLKTLEEAPSYAVLILTADNPEQLLPTIVSRCEVLRLRPLKIEDVEKALQVRGVQGERAKLVAHISGGRFGYALRMLEDETLLEKREERLNDLQRLIAASRVEKFATPIGSRKTRDPCAR